MLDKDYRSSKASSMRAITLLFALLHIIDVLLLASLWNFLNTALPCHKGCYVGARPRIQCLDIAHGLQTVVEKGLDSLGASSLAQAEIKRYYDSLLVLRIIRLFIYSGVPKAHAMCFFRHQMCPQVTLRCGQVVSRICFRII